jgi:dTDP-4-dehydrorhamnose reductase
MAYLIAGAGGQLGSAFAARLMARGDEVLALARADLDLTDPAAVQARVEAARPSVILNCAANNAVDHAEDDAPGALAVNAFAVLSLARAAASVGAAFVHYSTDFVFDGAASAPYAETDPPCPRSVYGQSKLVGEWFALDEAPGSYVLRVESLFGGPRSRSSIDKIVASLRAGQQARVFVDRVVTPSYVEDVIDATFSLLDRGAAGGLYHCVNTGETTWQALACVVAEHLHADPGLLVPVTVADVSMRAPRPQYCALSNRKLAEAGVVMPAWQDAIARHLASLG